MPAIIFIILLLFIPILSETDSSICLPIDVEFRTDLSVLKLTNIGTFGLERKARKGVPVHLHTGIDIQRPSQNYDNEKIFPMSKGNVISIRDDGPFAQIIIEHSTPHGTVWSVYEHVTGISCRVGDSVSPDVPIAHFFSKTELDYYGWQFDHFHFEILKQKPTKVAYNPSLPERQYATYALVCYTYEQLMQKYFNPIIFFEQSFAASLKEK